MFEFKHTVSITAAAEAIRDLVGSTRTAIKNGEYHPSGRIWVTLTDTFTLSIVNNSHAFNDDWDGAATLEVALLKNGILVGEEDHYNEVTIINGIDYHQLANLFKRICQKGHFNIFRLWVECYRLTDSRFFTNSDEDILEHKEYVKDLLSNKAYLSEVKSAIYA